MFPVCPGRVAYHPGTFGRAGEKCAQNTRDCNITGRARLLLLLYGYLLSRAHRECEFCADTFIICHLSFSRPSVKDADAFCRCVAVQRKITQRRSTGKQNLFASKREEKSNANIFRTKLNKEMDASCLLQHKCNSKKMFRQQISLYAIFNK